MPESPYNLIDEKTREKLDAETSAPERDTQGLARSDAGGSAAALFAIPAQMLATYKERMFAVIAHIAQCVPEERRRQAPASIAGPILERLKYAEDESPLKAFYVNLLTRAIDRDRQGEAHPAFISIIEQLSKDEAVFLVCLKRGDIQITQKNRNYAPGRPVSGTSFFLPNIAPDIDPEAVPKDLLMYPQHMKMYLSHLLALNLIKIKAPPKVDNQREWLTWTVQPSDLGKLFLGACMGGE